VTTPANPGATTWRVTGQTEQTQIQQGGNPVRGVQVFYTTGDGHTGSVFIPYAQYNPAYVQQQVGQAAAQMDAVGQLSGTVPAT
jgi:hypothetical protein